MIELINWLNREIASADHELSKYDPMSVSRVDECDTSTIKGMKAAYENVKKHLMEMEKNRWTKAGLDIINQNFEKGLRHETKDRTTTIHQGTSCKKKETA